MLSQKHKWWTTYLTNLRTSSPLINRTLKAPSRAKEGWWNRTNLLMNLKYRGQNDSRNNPRNQVPCWSLNTAEGGLWWNYDITNMDVVVRAMLVWIYSAQSCIHSSLTYSIIQRSPIYHLEGERRAWWAVLTKISSRAWLSRHGIFCQTAQTS